MRISEYTPFFEHTRTLWPPKHLPVGKYMAVNSTVYWHTDSTAIVVVLFAKLVWVVLVVHSVYFITFVLPVELVEESIITFYRRGACFRIMPFRIFILFFST